MAVVSEEEFALPEELVASIRNKRCLAFIGSGASSGCYDNWPNLVNRLCEHAGSKIRVTNKSTTEEYLIAAQDAKDCNETIYYRELGEHFGKPNNITTPIYSALLALPFASYVTTNFDPLLATQARYFNCRFPPMAYPRLDRAHILSRSIYYIHGYIAEHQTPVAGTIVLSKSEFDEAYGDHGIAMRFLLDILDHDSICFVGHSMREPVMKPLIEICKKNQQNRLRAINLSGQRPSSPPKRYILISTPHIIIDGKIDIEQSQARTRDIQEFYRELEITPVFYPASGGDHSPLRRAFERVIGLPDAKPDYGWDGGLNAIQC